ncbi:MAG: beta-N-acetylhexosaminidase, partial [Alphaproteobacteria bacterium]|nr:beta-N-acetylhexosaminidase [Alphaproteobacteria bacterium]
MSKNSSQPAAVIFGCSGLVLSDEEKRFFAASNPLGFILFGRNIGTPEQVRALVNDLRATVERADAPVLIDQEGGRVQRLGPPHWRKVPPAAVFADLVAAGKARGLAGARLNARLLAEDLRNLGIDVNGAPVLDVPVEGAHDIIGDRAYGRSPERVAPLGRAMCDGLLDGGVLPVIKHIPGHGRALSDSHLDLPVVDAPASVLEETDFAPFRALRDAPWAMTAHVVYLALDPERPATLSPFVVKTVIRERIGFDGLLLTDDLSMRALSGSFGERTRLALAA